MSLSKPMRWISLGGAPLRVGADGDGRRRRTTVDLVLRLVMKPDPFHGRQSLAR